MGGPGIYLARNHLHFGFSNQKQVGRVKNMQAPTFRRAIGFALAFAAVFMSVSPALAINVQPVIIDLLSSGRRASGVVTLQNTFPDAVPIEVTIHPVRVVDGELQEMQNEEVEDVLAFPAQAIVAPGGSQAFRIQWVGDPRPAASAHYYVTISQLPVALQSDQNTIQVLHRFRVLVNVNSPEGNAELKIIKANVVTAENGKARPVVTIANSGNASDYVGNHRLTLVQQDAAGHEVFRETYLPEQIQQAMGLGMIPSGQTRILPMGIDLPTDSKNVSIEIATEFGD